MLEFTAVYKKVAEGYVAHVEELPGANTRVVVTDDTAGTFAVVHGDVLTARNDARIAPTHYADWLSAQKTRRLSR